MPRVNRYCPSLSCPRDRPIRSDQRFLRGPSRAALPCRPEVSELPGGVFFCPAQSCRVRLGSVRRAESEPLGRGSAIVIAPDRPCTAPGRPCRSSDESPPHLGDRAAARFNSKRSSCPRRELRNPFVARSRPLTRWLPCVVLSRGLRQLRRSTCDRAMLSTSAIVPVRDRPRHGVIVAAPSAGVHRGFDRRREVAEPLGRLRSSLSRSTFNPCQPFSRRSHCSSRLW